ncbi:hypothetical protein [Paraburkholderia sp. J10-1]|uniref:hypothetical protein n=1 Tax=Paraburkholderia sp. J10-1 TaxID=2805430 RepID=UPI002AB681CC|nr:hypothetical protein [Paraburkholderia sp. J10-1]
MKTIIEIEFTSEQIAVGYNGPSILAVHETGDPFPRGGDLIELEVGDATERFRVVERVLSFRTDALHIILILGR